MWPRRWWVIWRSMDLVPLGSSAPSSANHSPIAAWVRKIPSNILAWLLSGIRTFNVERVARPAQNRPGAAGALATRVSNGHLQKNCRGCQGRSAPLYIEQLLFTPIHRLLVSAPALAERRHDIDRCHYQAIQTGGRQRGSLRAR